MKHRIVFARICTGLKLSEPFLEAEFDRLSGGEKTLVCLLQKHCSSSRIFSYWMNRPQPSGYVHAKWLEEYLKAYRRTVATGFP